MNALNNPASDPGFGQESITVTANGVCFKMIHVQCGTFFMGATREQLFHAWDDEKPIHQVTLSSYYLGETEVTQELWLAVMGSNPSRFKFWAQRPVEQVSWEDCQEFIRRLNQITGRAFRLPTEAEWEFAARGGIRSCGNTFSGSNHLDEVGWYWKNACAVGESSADYGTHDVKTKPANELGLYDMSGNVWEWCQDWEGSYDKGAQTDPKGPDTGVSRIFRGGSWKSYEGNCHISGRDHSSPSSRDFSVGLRLAL